MTVAGKFVAKVPPSTTKANAGGKGANPATGPATAKETSAWNAASPWVHGALGLASFVPGLSVVTGGLDAALYLAEGNPVEAGIAAVSMIPGGKVVTTARRVVKGAVGIAQDAKALSTAAKAAKAAEDAAQAVKAAKAAQEAKAAAQAVQAAKLGKKAAAPKAVASKAKKAGGGKNPKKDTTVKKRKPGPCDHLLQGSGKGPYRGGAHSKTRLPKGDGKDSHHMPTDKVSPLERKMGPAIQMEIDDHRRTRSNGKAGAIGAAYRENIRELLNSGQWRKAMRIEIDDVRRVARATGNSKKYNEAMREMLEYFKCLEKNGLLK